MRLVGILAWPLMAFWVVVTNIFEVVKDFFVRLIAPYSSPPLGIPLADAVRIIWERRRARPAWRRHHFPEPLIVFRQYNLEHEDDYWDAIARIEAADMALADTPSSRPFLQRLLAFVTATLQSIASSILTRSDSAAITTQTDAPTSSDAMISNDTAEADVTMPPVSRLHPRALPVRVEYTTASDDRGSYPLHMVHLAPGSRLLSEAKAHGECSTCL
ncbi:uncharacterized protein N7500_001114 [Penicillium coprophilum]|uniref:uncharacterized protein n=1 Tax=Penicillium coprophilum TaxID=36646 RepID=UPI0023A3A311|nr:uncharacterized protein N7500_001114 [Penicillium coprophilum]KAJ5178415.1 hypothetical protein N7500_001114 [Penicillium coprophilum]